MAIPLNYPPYQQPIVDRATSHVTTPWHRFFLSLVSGEALVRLVPDLVPVAPPLTAAAVSALGYWTPISNGDPLAFELLYTSDTGACVVGFVPTPS